MFRDERRRGGVTITLVRHRRAPVLSIRAFMSLGMLLKVMLLTVREVPIMHQVLNTLQYLWEPWKQGHHHDEGEQFSE